MQSNFPPLLGAYHPPLADGDGRSSRPLIHRKVRPPAAQLTGDGGEGREAKGYHKLTGGELAAMKRKSGGGRYLGSANAAKPLSSCDKLRLEQEKEQQRKRAKRSEDLLRAWEALQQRERDEKFSVLQRRVKIQRDLINKTEQLTHEHRARMRQKEEEEAHARRVAHKEMLRDLRNHSRKVQEHKEKIATKLSQLKSMDLEGTSSETRDYQASSPESTTCNDEEAGDGEARGRGEVGPICKLPTVHTMWKLRKADVVRKLRPMEYHSHQLKQVASPSVKECLEVFEQPTIHDQYTGKPIPLTQILTEISQLRSKEKSLRCNTSLRERSIKQTQRKAEIMLQRREQSMQHCVQHDPGWYLGEEISDSRVSPRDTTTENKSAPLHSESPPLLQCHRINPNMRKKFPQFLTASDSIVSSSLVEFGDKAYFYPSKSKRSFFLTDLDRDDERSSSHSDRQGSVGSWQPLSLSALSEYSGVMELHTQEHLPHGEYKLWRPVPIDM